MQASGTNDEGEEIPSGVLTTELLIGMCEDDLEVILSGESFGPSTPQISELTPVFNYIRPAGTDVKKMSIFEDQRNASSLRGYQNFYEYKRSNTSKFIDIDIQNADECFLDTEPETTTVQECPLCASDANARDCTCVITNNYGMRTSQVPQGKAPPVFLFTDYEKGYLHYLLVAEMH